MPAERVTELSDRLTFWLSPHPLWGQNPEWPEEVGCVMYAAPDATVLIDPLIRSDLDHRAWDWLDRAVGAAGSAVAVLLTAAWHRRSAQEVVQRYDGSLWVDSCARERFADLPQLARLPTEIEIFAPRGVDDGQVAFYVRSERTLVVGDFLLGTDAGLEVCPSPATSDMSEFAGSLSRRGARPSRPWRAAP